MAPQGVAGGPTGGRAGLEMSSAAAKQAVPVRRVLVVDDDPDINRLVRTRLAARGFQVAEAANGEEALAVLAATAPDLLFLDVAMPGIGGLEVLERLRADQRDVAVVMMTAFGSEQVAIEALRRGADDYLRKPFDRLEFQAVLDRTVQRLTLSRENATLQRQLAAELARAAEVQATLLPRSAPPLAGYELAARCLPAREVGGDFYDWQIVPDGSLTLAFGDVMGKGMPAALWMATARAALRTVAWQHAPADAMRAVAGALEADLERADAFITLFLLRLYPAAGRLIYIDAGHGYAFIRRRAGEVALLGPRALPLGVLPGESYTEGGEQLRPGDALVLYSDGIVEAQPDLAPDHTTLAALLAGMTSAAAMAERLVELAIAAPTRPDDATVAVLYRSSEGSV